jgi:hypothetical protein
MEKETRDQLDPLRQDVDEKTQPLPSATDGESVADASDNADFNTGDNADINTGYPPVRQSGWDQLSEAREVTDRIEAQDGLGD